MVNVTFNLIAAIEVDGRQLRQGLEAFEVSCVEQGCISVYMENFPGTFSSFEASMGLIMTQTIVLCRLVGTIENTFNPLAVLEVDLSQLCQGRQAREVACSRKARMHKCLHGEHSRNVQLLP